MNILTAVVDVVFGVDTHVHTHSSADIQQRIENLREPHCAMPGAMSWDLPSEHGLRPRWAPAVNGIARSDAKGQ